MPQLGTVTATVDVMITNTARLAQFDPASHTCTVKLVVPDPDGVPEMIPVDAFRERPVGRLPTEIVHV